MTTSPSELPEPPSNGMTHWGNDDLLITQAHRDFLEAEYPGALAAFDFPELRALFASFDSVANRHRAHRQRNGLAAILVAAIGAALSSILPITDLLGKSVSAWAFAFAAFLSVAGLLWGIILIMHDPDKDAWLHHRLKTERLRQFYFQLHLSDPLLVARAMHDREAAALWSARRLDALKLFTAWLAKPMRSAVNALVEDTNDRGVWFFEIWTEPPAMAANAVLDDYFSILRRQRIGVQLDYVRETLASGLSSPATRLAIADTLSWMLTASTLVITAYCAVQLFLGLTTQSVEFGILMSLAALFGVLSALIRVTADGLNLRGDVARYRWYRDALATIDGDFNDRDPKARLTALRELEVVTYRELREFIAAHGSARFNFG